MGPKLTTPDKENTLEIDDGKTLFLVRPYCAKERDILNPGVKTET